MSGFREQFIHQRLRETPIIVTCVHAIVLIVMARMRHQVSANTTNASGAKTASAL